jgi:hypothetical protein
MQLPILPFWIKHIYYVVGTVVPAYVGIRVFWPRRSVGKNPMDVGGRNECDQ